MIYKKSISALIAICIVISLFSMVILPKEGVAATVTGLTNQYTYVRAAPYWTAEVIDTMASGVAITIYERDYDYIYVEWTNAGVVKRGYIPRANTSTTGYSWCDHTIFVPGKTTANKTVYYKPGGTSYGTVYANEYPLLILRQSGSYYFVQYTTNPDATGSTNPKFKRGWITTASVTLSNRSYAPFDVLETGQYMLIRNYSGKYLTAVADSSETSGYKVTFANPQNTTAQQWVIYTYLSGNSYYYKIKSVSTGLYLDIDGKIPVIGTKLILSALASPQKAQEFSIDLTIGDSAHVSSQYDWGVRLYTRCSGDYLVLQHSGTNTNLTQYRAQDGNTNQFLYLDPIDNHWANGHAGGKRALTYYIDPYTVVTGNITTDIIEAAANSWNNISDISLTRVMSDSNADLIIEGTTANVNYYGALFVKTTLASTDWVSEDSDLNSTWYKGKIELNVNKTNSSSIGNKSTNDIQKVIAHEMGHFLKLSHPHEGYEDGEYVTYRNFHSIMNQGLPSISSLCSVTPSAYDIRSLKIKWDQ